MKSQYSVKDNFPYGEQKHSSSTNWEPSKSENKETNNSWPEL